MKYWKSREGLVYRVGKNGLKKYRIKLISTLKNKTVLAPKTLDELIGAKYE